MMQMRFMMAAIFFSPNTCGFGTSVEVLKAHDESIPVILRKDEELANVCLSMSMHSLN
jgi:hypothetical protein